MGLQQSCLGLPCTLSRVHSSGDGKDAAALQQNMEIPQRAPFPILSLPHHLISFLILPRVSDAASVRAFLSSCKAAHSLDGTLLQAFWLEQQRPYTALHLAAGPNGSEAQLLQLLDRPHVVAASAARFRLEPLLLKASKAGYGQAVQKMLQLPGIDANAPGEGNMMMPDTPLLAASERGHAQVVEQLLQTGRVDLGQRGGKSRLTALHFAAREGHDQVVSLLLRQVGVDVNARNMGGGTPLLLASWRGHPNVVLQLLQHKDIDTRLPNNQGLTPLDVASMRGDRVVVALLMH